VHVLALLARRPRMLGETVGVMAVLSDVFGGRSRDRDGRGGVSEFGLQTASASAAPTAPTPAPTPVTAAAELQGACGCVGGCGACLVSRTLEGS